MPGAPVSRNASSSCRWASPLTLCLMIALALSNGGAGAAPAKREPKPKKPENKPPVIRAADPNAPAAALSRQYSFGLYQVGYRSAAPKGSTAMLPRAANGSTLLTHLPLEGAGPWLDARRSAWHRGSFADMARAGINVALVQYPADLSSRQEWGRQGLDMAAQAIREMRAQGQSAPSLAPSLDFSQDPKWNLNRIPDRLAFYSVVRDFYRRVPPAYRTLVSLPGTDALPNAHPVFLGTPNGLAGISAEFVTEFRKWFEKEFGRPVALAGEQGWKTAAPNLDAYYEMDPAKPLGRDATGPLSTATLTPSYNERGLLGDNVPIRARMNGRPYVAAWNDTGKQRPDWVLLNSWNGWRDGTELAPSRESGDRDLNLTRAALAHMDSNEPYRARLLQQSVPSGMHPGALVRVEFRVENAGVQPWTENLSKLRYAWLRDGQAVASGESSLTRTVRAREEHTVGLLVPARSSNGPLEEGEYQLRFSLTAPGIDPAPPGHLSLGTYAVRVGSRPEMAATLLDSAMPLVLQPGPAYRARVRLRNDGSRAWTQADHTLTYRWRRVSDNTTDSNDVPRDLPPLKDELALKTPLRVDVLPGTLADVEASVAALDAQGKPLPPSTPESGWHYELDWVVTGPNGVAVTRSPEAVNLVKRDPGIDFPLGSGLPREMNADSPHEVKVVVRNIGPEKWTSGQVQLGARWYYWDGVPMNWDSPRVPVSGPLGDLSPGEQALVRIPVQAPPLGGMFLVSVEAYVDGEWASALPATRGAVVVPESIAVRGGGFQPLTIAGTKLYNFDGISPDAVPSDGNFDGRGNSFPGQLLPPLVTPEEVRSALYPSGYLGPVLGVGLDANRRVPFEFPPKVDGGPNMVAASGQNIRVQVPRCSAVHFLMASDVDLDAEFAFTFEDGSQKREQVNMSAWDRAPAFPNESVGFYTPVRNTPSGVERHDTYLKHYAIRFPEKPTLASIDFPNDSRVKIVAMTVETW
ncbi:MAG: hypothetical protein KY468_07410 [Armatimonadetes bacterium]|nr:hypothetical protein [Armatimonadota bacterium]